MLSVKPRFEDVLATAWQIACAGKNAYCVSGPANAIVTYTTAELTAVDPRLPTLLKQGSPHDRPTMVRTSLAYWKEPAISKITTLRTIYGTGVVKFVIGIKTINCVTVQDTTNLYVIAESYGIDTTKDGIDYAIQHMPDRLECLPRVEVELCFPGAWDRVTVALTLGLTPTEVAQHAFHYSGSDQRVDLPGTLILACAP